MGWVRSGESGHSPNAKNYFSCVFGSPKLFFSPIPSLRTNERRHEVGVELKRRAYVQQNGSLRGTFILEA